MANVTQDADSIKKADTAQKNYNRTVEITIKTEKQLYEIRRKSGAQLGQQIKDQGKLSTQRSYSMPEYSTPGTSATDYVMGGVSLAGFKGAAISASYGAISSFYKDFDVEQKKQLALHVDKLNATEASGITNANKSAYIMSLDTLERAYKGVLKSTTEELKKAQAEYTTVTTTKRIYGTDDMGTEGLERYFKANPRATYNEDTKQIEDPYSEVEIYNRSLALDDAKKRLQITEQAISEINQAKTYAVNTDFSKAPVQPQASQQIDEQESLAEHVNATIVIYQQQYDWVKKLAIMRAQEREEERLYAEELKKRQDVMQGRSNAQSIADNWALTKLSEEEKINRNEANALNGIDSAFNKELAWENSQRSENGLDPITADQALLLEQYQVYQRAKTAIAEQAEADRDALVLAAQERDRASIMLGLSSMATAMDGLMGMAEQSKGRQSKTYQTLFAMSKGFAIAQAALNLQVAVSKAFADGQTMPERFANMALVLAQGVKLVSAVQSISMSGQAHAGIDYVPREGTWLLDRGERVVDSRTNADLKHYLKQQDSSSGGGSISINIPLTVQGADNGNGASLAEDANMLAAIIKSKVFEIVTNEQRPGGILSRG